MHSASNTTNYSTTITSFCLFGASGDMLLFLSGQRHE